MSVNIYFFAFFINLVFLSATIESSSSFRFIKGVESSALKIEFPQVVMGVKTLKNYRQPHKIKVFLLASPEFKLLAQKRHIKNLIYNAISNTPKLELLESKKNIPTLIEKMNSFVHKAEVYDIYIEILEEKS